METDSCLVLYIEEHDNEHNNVVSIDTRLFITYDFENDCYVLYGKRDNINSINYEPYFFRCDNTNELYKFITFIIDIDNKCNLTLYNYNNMPTNCENVNYEFMENNRDRCYELAGYDGVNLEKKTVNKMLRMLRNIYNYF
jgi:hypothetical protein